MAAGVSPPLTAIPVAVYLSGLSPGSRRTMRGGAEVHRRLRLRRRHRAHALLVAARWLRAVERGVGIATRLPRSARRNGGTSRASSRGRVHRCRSVELVHRPAPPPARHLGLERVTPRPLARLPKRESTQCPVPAREARRPSVRTALLSESSATARAEHEPARSLQNGADASRGPRRIRAAPSRGSRPEEQLRRCPGNTRKRKNGREKAIVLDLSAVGFVVEREKQRRLPGSRVAVEHCEVGSTPPAQQRPVLGDRRLVDRDVDRSKARLGDKAVVGIRSRWQSATAARARRGG